MTRYRVGLNDPAAWFATAARVLLAGVWIVAGGLKAEDLNASVRAVRAYRLLPETAAQVVGAGLPFVEITLGLLLLAGLGVRACAVASGALLTVFVIGIASAWARGLIIDCGCFGSGGQLASTQAPGYGWDGARDGGLLLVAVLLAVRPGSRFAAENLWNRAPGIAQPAEPAAAESGIR